MILTASTFYRDRLRPLYLQEYDPDLFGNALPCLTAIGCALPPDYSLTTGYEDELFRQSTRTDAKYIPQPIDTGRSVSDTDTRDGMQVTRMTH